MIMLTTEALPTEMVRQLRPDEAPLEVLDLRTPAIRAGTVQVRLKTVMFVGTRYRNR